MLAVGGTTLNLNANNSIQSETAWSVGSDYWNTSLGTGGGVSVYEAEPAYQEGVQHTGFRSIPDVSMDADPATGVTTYDSFNSSGFQSIGGTSLSAPCWAGLVAIADQGRLLDGGTTLNGATQTLPDLYKLPSSDFNDITSGSNGQYKAGPGYDMVTGLGTPKANLLVPALAAFGLTQQTTHVVVTSQPGNIVAGNSINFQRGGRGPVRQRGSLQRLVQRRPDRQPHRRRVQRQRRRDGNQRHHQPVGQDHRQGRLRLQHHDYLERRGLGDHQLLHCVSGPGDACSGHEAAGQHRRRQLHQSGACRPKTSSATWFPSPGRTTSP